MGSQPYNTKIFHFILFTDFKQRILIAIVIMVEREYTTKK